ncbi:MAG TPA: hypothetical protein VFV76_02675 [Actinomycetes bacterium]|nr:hypothetical protein [Actinomycetes bacterium]
MDVDAVADELYSLPPEQFVAARDDRVKEARADGDREAARAIAAFRRPTVVAWLANLLARHHPEDVEPFLELGEALRDATATLSGPELRELSKQRQQLVQALVRKARALADDVGHRVGEDAARGLEETLHAALADPEAGTRLVEGRLTGALSHTGFQPPVDTAKSSRPSTTPAKKEAAEPSAEDKRRAARRERIERDLGEAWAQARRAAEARDAAEGQVRAVEDRRSQATKELRRLRQALEAAERDLADAEEERDHLVRSRDRADKEAQRARQRVADLQARLEEL